MQELPEVGKLKPTLFKLPEDLLERVRGTVPGSQGGKQGGVSLVVRQMLHLYLGEQMPTADQWHLAVDDENPLRQMEARVYALEHAAHENPTPLTAADLAELATTKAALLELARPLVASRQPSFEQALAVTLLGRCALLRDHLARAGLAPPKAKAKKKR